VTEYVRHPSNGLSDLHQLRLYGKAFASNRALVNVVLYLLHQRYYHPLKNPTLWTLEAVFDHEETVFQEPCVLQELFCYRRRS
jgi:hypothetical protein